MTSLVCFQVARAADGVHVLHLQGTLHQQQHGDPRLPDRPQGGAGAADGGQLPLLLRACRRQPKRADLGERSVTALAARGLVKQRPTAGNERLILLVAVLSRTVICSGWHRRRWQEEDGGVDAEC